MAVEGYFVRHAESVWNSLGLLQGQKNIPLSERGIKQAEELTKQVGELGVSIIYTSPLLRALETAKIINSHLKAAVVIHDGLKERSYGEFEGKLLDDIYAQLKKKNATLKLYRSEKGEAYSDFKTRVRNTFDEIVSKHKNEKILFVCHGGVMEVLAKYVSDKESEDKDDGDIGYGFGNASIHTFRI